MSDSTKLETTDSTKPETTSSTKLETIDKPEENMEQILESINTEYIADAVGETITQQFEEWCHNTEGFFELTEEEQQKVQCAWYADLLSYL